MQFSNLYIIAKAIIIWDKENNYLQILSKIMELLLLREFIKIFKLSGLELSLEKLECRPSLVSIRFRQLI